LVALGDRRLNLLPTLPANFPDRHREDDEDQSAQGEGDLSGSGTDPDG
jgi:hypothetical protein